MHSNPIVRAEAEKNAAPAVRVVVCDRKVRLVMLIIRILGPV
jgi:hypothetical protein